jgi:hypothetical protein
MSVAQKTATAPPDWLRHAVRGVLAQSAGYRELPQPQQRALAQAMVRVSAIAAGLIAEETEAHEALKQGRTRTLGMDETRRPEPRARAQDVPAYGTSADRIAGITQSVLNAVSFPRFVTDLINGVFKSMIDSNAQQMQLYVQLLNNVSASAEGFERSQFSIAGVRQWVADHFPDRIEYDVPETEPGDDPPDPEDLANIKLRLRDGASMPDAEELRATLGVAPEESIDAGDPEALVPLARRQIARQRQQMLATMVMLGMQRIVIDSGRINASMRFHIDTRSAATEDRGSQFGLQNRIKASGSFGVGAWGASAEVENTISYVSTQRSQNTEEMNTDLNLDSSVELVFKTDYLPLERLAGGPQLERIKVNTLNPNAETKAITDARTARDKANIAAEAGRSSAIDKALAPPPLPAAPAQPKVAPSAPPKAPEKKTDKKPDKKPGATPPGTAAAGSGNTARPGATTPPAAPGAGTAAPAAGGSTPATNTSAQALAIEPMSRPPDVVYVPTPESSVATMLELAAPKPSETLVDLGCGDGRILVAAAQRYGCRALGYDIDPARISEARARITAAGLSGRVRAEVGDLFQVDLSAIDVVTLYLLPQLNAKLIPRLMQLRPGARVVSHDFDIAGISPDRVVQEYLPKQGHYKTYFLYVAPLRENAEVRHQWAESAKLSWERAASP